MTLTFILFGFPSAVETAGESLPVSVARGFRLVLR